MRRWRARWCSASTGRSTRRSSSPTLCPRAGRPPQTDSVLTNGRLLVWQLEAGPAAKPGALTIAGDTHAGTCGVQPVPQSTLTVGGILWAANSSSGPGGDQAVCATTTIDGQYTDDVLLLARPPAGAQPGQPAALDDVLRPGPVRLDHAPESPARRATAKIKTTSIISNGRVLRVIRPRHAGPAAGAVPGSDRTRRALVPPPWPLTKTSGAATAPTHTAMSGAPGSGPDICSGRRWRRAETERFRHMVPPENLKIDCAPGEYPYDAADSP